MGIKPICDKCGDELIEPGALMFGPPQSDNGMVSKWHLCRPCWRMVNDFVNAKWRKTVSG